MKSKFTLLTSAISMIAFGYSNVNADCTLTTNPETDGRCFFVNGEYECLERTEDTNCFVPNVC